MKLVIACITSLIWNTGLFSFLPILVYWQRHADGNRPIKTHDMKLTAMSMMAPKKEKPPEREKSERTEKKTLEPGKNVSRQRFVMDLGVGNGLGLGATVAAVSDRNLQQATYAEGETDVDAKPISRTVPTKPKKAESAGIHGLVRCLLTIGENGQVVNIQFLEVPAKEMGFEESVKEAVLSWRFQPATLDGVPVRQRIEQPFRF